MTNHGDSTCRAGPALSTPRRPLLLASMGQKTFARSSTMPRACSLQWFLSWRHLAIASQLLPPIRNSLARRGSTSRCPKRGRAPMMTLCAWSRRKRRLLRGMSSLMSRRCSRRGISILVATRHPSRSGRRVCTSRPSLAWPAFETSAPTSSRCGIALLVNCCRSMAAARSCGMTISRSAVWPRSNAHMRRTIGSSRLGSYSPRWATSTRNR
mmetsp:Transcript_61040/g.137808  ORF Transcript_61040/g.137808 Transcript_61040/m.137808 type:complete len:211 (+) Transcript_61040:189-821(+)